MSSRAELQRCVLQAATCFRLGLEAEGSAHLAAFVDGALPLLADPAEAELAARLSPYLGPITAAQARGDYLGVADLLEYELAVHL